MDHVITLPLKPELPDHPGAPLTLTEAEQQLRLSEARYRALMAATGCLVWTSNAIGVIHALPDWHAFTGLPGPVITNDIWVAAMHPGDRDRARAQWDDAVARRVNYESEYRLLRHDGVYRWFLDRGVPILEADGSIREWIGTATDISERRAAADEKLRSSEEQLRAVVLHAPIEVFALDLDGTFSLHLRGTLGRATSQAGDWIGQHITVTHADRPECFAHFHAAAGGSVSTQVEEIESRVFETHWVPRFALSGLVDGVMGTCIDVTERAHAQHDAEALAHLRRDFVAAVSHELRTPLTAIVGYSELLLARWPTMSDSARQDQIARIVVAANRQMRLVEDLLLLSQVETRSLAAKCEVLTVAVLAGQAVDEVHGAYAGQQIVIKGAADTALLGDRSRVLQILVNLIDNAAKYSPDGAPISVFWNESASAVSIYVRDHGPGIPDSGLQYLFTRFGRVPGSRVRLGRIGTGLGLYLSRQMAEAMSGTLDLDATGEKGSMFRLRLPSAKA